MNKSGSLCPAVKASEIIGDKWTLLILRELLFGASRYNEFQRAMPRISPTVLSKRLKQMEQHGLIIHKTATVSRSSDYLLTKSGRELGPIIDGLARWGLRWAKDQLCDQDLDAGTFMWDFHRTLNVAELPDGDTVFSVILNGQNNKQWWMIAQNGAVDLCDVDPGREVDIYITSTLTELATLWMGDINLANALKKKTLSLMGADYYLKSAERWFPQCIYADENPSDG